METEIDVFDETFEFVQNATEHFDESHDAGHALEVYRLTMQIAEMSMKEGRWIDAAGMKILTIASLCHDVCDSKYTGKGVTYLDLQKFVNEIYPEKAMFIMYIIDNISYSREVKGERKILMNPYEIYRNMISDADKILAIGRKGIERCYKYSMMLYGVTDATVTDEDKKKLNERVLTHCHEKLKLLYPNKFIYTKEGRQIAEPLHQEVLDYIREAEGTDNNKKN